MDSGIVRPEEKISIVPLRMAECELMYENEITPTVSSHAIKALKEGIEDVMFVKRMLNILSSHFFDDKCIHSHSYSPIKISNTFHRRHQEEIQYKRRDRLPRGLL